MQYTWTDQQLITAIKSGGQDRDKAWEYIIKAWRSVYLGIIVKLGGTIQEVDAVLSYAVMDVDKQVRRDDFALHSASLRTYFITPLIRHWADKFPKGKLPATVEFDGMKHETGKEPSPEETILHQERQQKVRDALSKLGERCKTILTMYAAGYLWKEIAEQLNISLQNAKNTAEECKTKLRERLQGKI